MRRFLFTVAAMVVVALAAYLGLFQREALWGLWTRSKLAAEGYGPAKTPSEAMDKFLKAIKDRNYEAAESYLGGDYAEQFHKGAKQGQPLGVAIDNLNSAMEKTGVKSDRVKVVLKLMDPFPTGLKVVDVKQDGDKAHATVTEEPGVLLRPDGRVENWDLPPALCHALFRGAGHRNNRAPPRGGRRRQVEAPPARDPDAALLRRLPQRQWIQLRQRVGARQGGRQERRHHQSGPRTGAADGVDRLEVNPRPESVV
jgi:hypothetical protein